MPKKKTKYFRIQRIRCISRKWRFWLNDVYKNEKRVIKEVIELNKQDEYIRENIHFRYVSVVKDKTATNERNSMLFNPFSKITKIYPVPTTMTVETT